MGKSLSSVLFTSFSSGRSVAASFYQFILNLSVRVCAFTGELVRTSACVLLVKPQ